jgi:DNA helicase HerA-like ATPase
VAEGWPREKAPSKAKATAVESLVANHTLIVGQSRSGKTTAGRRIIEEILAWTDARLIILDPNADFKYLAELDPDPKRNIKAEDQRFAEKHSRLRKVIAVATPGGSVWGIDWGKLTLEEMAAFLRLRPSGETFAEYRHLDRHAKYEGDKRRTLKQFIASPYFQVAVGEDLERYRLRLQELDSLKVWATDASKDLDSLFQQNYKAIVVDLSMDNEQEKFITAARTLEALWKDGESKRKDFFRNPETSWPGTLVVIDEGHLFAPPETPDPQKRLVSERIQRFADQGKKLNLFLMIITQPPGKLHPEVLAEFNNRIIMRVNERRSLKALEDMYGGSKGRYDGALTFEKGEAQIEGDLLRDENPPPPLPRGVKFRRSRTREGGGTPKTDWARPKADIKP